MIKEIKEDARHLREDIVEYLNWKKIVKYFKWKRVVNFLSVLLLFSLCLSIPILIFLLVDNFSYLSTYFSENHPYGELFKVCLTVLAGIGAVIALRYNHRRVTAMEKGNVDTRFNNAVGHLGNDNHTVVLGGIHALHQIAVKHKSYTLVIHNLFCSYLRENSAKLYDTKIPDKCPVIIQTLIDYLFKSHDNKESIYKNYKSDLSFSTLKNCKFWDVTLTKCDFSHAVLTKCDFNRAVLSSGHFCNSTLLIDVTFTECEFHRVFTKCVFNGNFIECKFKGSFTECKFNGNFTRCVFIGGFTECKFSGNLTECDFSETILTKCDFKKTISIRCQFISKSPYTNSAKLIATKLPPNENTQSENEVEQ